MASAARTEALGEIPKTLENSLFFGLPGLAQKWHADPPVTVRITVTQQETSRRIQVAGRLTGEEVGELEQAIGDDPRAACLDLAELRSADSEGLAALRRLRADGVELRGVPPHLAWRIESDEPTE